MSPRTALPPPGSTPSGRAQGKGQARRGPGLGGGNGATDGPGGAVTEEGRRGLSRAGAKAETPRRRGGSW